MEELNCDQCEGHIGWWQGDGGPTGAAFYCDKCAEDRGIYMGEIANA